MSVFKIWIFTLLIMDIHWVLIKLTSLPNKNSRLNFCCIIYYFHSQILTIKSKVFLKIYKQKRKVVSSVHILTRNTSPTRNGENHMSGVYLEYWKEKYFQYSSSIKHRNIWITHQWPSVKYILFFNYFTIEFDALSIR
jgi:hypothetical protein